MKWIVWRMSEAGRVLYLTEQDTFSFRPQEARIFPGAVAAARHIERNNIVGWAGMQRVQNVDLRKRRKRGRIR
jgi:hypothetical protein